MDNREKMYLLNARGSQTINQQKDTTIEAGEHAEFIVHLAASLALQYLRTYAINCKK